MALLMIAAASVPLMGQTPCDNADFRLRVGDIQPLDCFTVKVPVLLLANQNLTPLTACDFDLSGTVSGGNARIEDVIWDSGFDAFNITNNQTGFEIMGNDVSTGYSFGTLQPPLFEVIVRADPGEAFSFDFTEIDIDFGCTSSSNFQCDESHFTISPVGLSFRISAPAALEARLSIFNASGKQVYAEVLALDTGQQKVQLPAANTWPEGAYFYHLEAGESVQYGRLIKLQ